MGKISCGLLMFTYNQENQVLFFLAHPGGPFFKNKDKGAWTIPKGLPESEEELLKAACREFIEETGLTPTPPYIPLTPVKQAGGKVIHAWAFEVQSPNIPPVKSNTFEMIWPPKSGKKQSFPEVDKAVFFTLREAEEKINPAQKAFLLELLKKL